jgi:hypothetical protein
MKPQERRLRNVDDTMPNIHVGQSEEWDAFDSLPKAVREEISVAPFKFSARDIKNSFAGDPFVLFTNDKASYMLESVRRNFTQMTMNNSITKVENGTYRLVRKVHGKRRNTAGRV